jgi:hypothetical protein
LQDFDLGLNIGQAVVLGGIRHRIDVLHVHEVLVQVLDFERGARLIDGGFGKRDEGSGQQTGESDGQNRALAAAEDAPVLDESALGLLGGVAGVTGGGFRAVRICRLHCSWRRTRRTED